MALYGRLVWCSALTIYVYVIYVVFFMCCTNAWWRSNPLATSIHHSSFELSRPLQLYYRGATVVPTRRYGAAVSTFVNIVPTYCLSSFPAWARAYRALTVWSNGLLLLQASFSITTIFVNIEHHRVSGCMTVYSRSGSVASRTVWCPGALSVASPKVASATYLSSLMLVRWLCARTSAAPVLRAACKIPLPSLNSFV